MMLSQSRVQPTPSSSPAACAAASAVCPACSQFCHCPLPADGLGEDREKPPGSSLVPGLGGLLDGLAEH